VLAALGLVMYLGAGPAEEALLSGKVFSSDELKSAEAALRKENLTQYRVAGQRILVPQTEVTRYNAALAAGDGVPEFGDDLARALETNPFLGIGEPQRRDRVDLGKARELVKIMKAIPFVEDARLIPQRPRQRGFNRESKMTATLGIRLRGGRELTGDVAQSLRQTVAGGFDMAPADVTVVDMKTGMAARVPDPNDASNTGYVEAVRNFTAIYQQTIADALHYIPNVLVSVNVDLDVLMGIRDAVKPLAGLTPKSVQVAVAIPKDYYHDMALKRGGDKAEKSAFQAKVAKLKTETERDVREKVASLIPRPAGGTAADMINVSSYDRLETVEAPVAISPETRVREAATQWGGPAGLALCVLGVLWMLNRSTKLAPEEPAEATAGEQPAAKATAAQGALEGDDKGRTPREPTKRDKPPTPMNGDPVTAAAEIGGGMESAHDLLEPSLGREKAGAVLETVEQSMRAVPFGFLRDAGPENLLSLVVEEHPQTIALILSHIPAGLAAQVLSGLPSIKQLEVVRRIATMEQTSPEVVQEVEKSLERRMTSTFNRRFEKAEGSSSLAQMLNVTDRMANGSILESLEKESPELFDKIRRLMFVFDDLVKLDDQSLDPLLEEVENAQWALALKGASESLKGKIMRNLSREDAAMLDEEIQYLGPVRVSDVEAAQQAIVDTVRRLEDAGEIVVSAAAAERLFA
ncbi:MAG: flagellar motor switch protein FliG, partial [Deltaproteobacteria bacterium]